MHTTRRTLVTAVLALITALAVAGPPFASASARSTRPKPAVVEQLATPRSVRTVGQLTVHTEPTRRAPSIALPATTEFGAPTVLLADARQGPWLHVLLPLRPNGSSGWVHRAGLDVRRLADAITVDLAARTLVWTRGGVVVLETPVAVGTDANPTPRGRFFVTDLLQNEDPDGAYGPFAAGVAAHSDTLSDFAGGDGQIGLHGTDEPWSIGQAASHGCVRVPNDAISAIATGVALGTPVTIV
jgi:lipoprotein-anchoring transpeptidase ErfK/SrfK